MAQQIPKALSPEITKFNNKEGNNDQSGLEPVPAALATPQCQAVESSPASHHGSVKKFDLNGWEQKDEAHVCSETGESRIPSPDEGIASGVGWLPLRNTQPALMDRAAEPKGGKTGDAIEAKSIEEVTDDDIQQCSSDACGQHLEERGSRHNSSLKPAVMVNVPPFEKERSHAKYGRSLEEPSMLCTSHSIEDGFLSSQNLVKGYRISKGFGSLDSNGAENISAVQLHDFGITLTAHVSGASEKETTLMNLIDHAGAIPGSSICHPMFKEQLFSSPVSRVPLDPSSGAMSITPETGGLMTFNSPDSTSAQLTLFYAGTVNVYDNVPADKAQAIMLLAGSSSPWSAKALNSQAMHATCMQCPPVSCGLTTLKAQHMLKMQTNMQSSQTPAKTLSAGNAGQAISILGDKQQELSSLLSPCQPVVRRAMPQPRRASLARFLEKRKERMRSMAPYTFKNPCQALLLHIGKAALEVNPVATSNSKPLDCSGEDKVGNKHKLSDHGLRTLQNAVTYAMDVEDQNWLNTPEIPKQLLEAETATEFSSSCA